MSTEYPQEEDPFSIAPFMYHDRETKCMGEVMLEHSSQTCRRPILWGAAYIVKDFVLGRPGLPA